MYHKSRSYTIEFLCILSLSIIILISDYKFHALEKIKLGLSFASTPMQYIANIPKNIFQEINSFFTSHDTMLKENQNLKIENLLLQQKIQQIESLKKEKNYLKHLLYASKLIDEKVMLAEIINKKFSTQRTITINLGSSEGVKRGQTILGAYGIIGQVIKVMPLSSIVLLVTDRDSQIPVQINRTGYHSIVEGNGNPEIVELLHIPHTSDIKKGDLIITSGLGNKFPAGYPVGVVEHVQAKKGNSFIDVAVKLASPVLNRFVMLVYNEI